MSIFVFFELCLKILGVILFLSALLNIPFEVKPLNPKRTPFYISKREEPVNLEKEIEKLKEKNKIYANKLTAIAMATDNYAVANKDAIPLATIDEIIRANNLI